MSRQQFGENGIVSEATCPPLGMGSLVLKRGLGGVPVSHWVTGDAPWGLEQMSPQTPAKAGSLATWCGQQARGLAAQATREAASSTIIPYLNKRYSLSNPL
jgi:hypothetical protein